MAAPQKIGKYDIQDVLGKGGMGSVYRGFDPAISRAVAIKAISKGMVGEEDLKHIMQRFRHEAQAVGRLVIRALCRFTTSARTKTSLTS